MKLFASDFDGTLRRYDRREPYILACDQKAAAAYRAGGDLFAMCSGRAFHSILTEARAMPEADLYAVSTGAIIGRAHRGKMEILEEEVIPFETAREIHEKFGRPFDIFYVHAGGYLYRLNGRGKGETSQIFISSFEELPGDRIEDVSFCAVTAKNAERLAEIINREYSEQLTAFQNNDYLDIVKKGCSKKTGMEKLREICRPSLTGGIGDSFNDIPLFEGADVSFTFDFADPRVQARADYIVKNVAEALEIFAKL